MPAAYMVEKVWSEPHLGEEAVGRGIFFHQHDTIKKPPVFRVTAP